MNLSEILVLAAPAIVVAMSVAFSFQSRQAHRRLISERADRNLKQAGRKADDVSKAEQTLETMRLLAESAAASARASQTSAETSQRIALSPARPSETGQIGMLGMGLPVRIEGLSVWQQERLL